MAFKNDVLCRKFENNTGDEITWQMILPKVLRKTVMKKLHDKVTGGHLGKKKMLSRVTARFYWHQLRSEIESWCQTCDICARRKMSQGKVKAPMKQYIVGEQLERIVETCN